MKSWIVTAWLCVANVAFAGFLDNGGWVVDGEPESLPPPVGLSSNSIDPVTDAAYRAVPSWSEVLGIDAVADRDISLGGHSMTGVASVVVSNTVDAGGFSASGTVGRTSAGHGFKAGLLTDTNAFGSFVAGVSAGVSGTDKVTKAYVDAGDVAATNAANILAGQKYVSQGGAVTASTFRCLAYEIWIQSQFGDPTDFARIINSNSLAWTYWLPAKDGVFAMMSDIPSTAGMVTNGGNATLGTVSVSNGLDAGSYSASGTVGRTSASHGFKAGLLTDTNALGSFVAGVSAGVSGTDKVTKAYVDAGDVAATNAANVLAGQKYVPLGAAVTNGGNATLGTVSVSSLTIGGNVPLTNAPGSASLVFYVNRFTQAVDLVNTDTGAVPNEIYGINLKSAGVIAKDVYSGWSTGALKYVVGSSLAGKDLHVSFDSVVQGAGGGVGSGYAKRRKITFPVVVGTLTNFPALVKFTAAEYTGFQGTNGADLRFTDSAGAELVYEVDAWNSGTNSFVWVQVPVLTNGAFIWAYWGRVGVSAPIYTANGSTWTNFNLVGHMGQSNLLDSTALHNSADRNGIHTNALGVVGGGRGFLRGDSIGWQPNFPASVGLLMTNGFAVEAWVNKVNSGGTDGLIGMYHSGGWPFVDSLRINTDGSDVPYMTLRRIGADADVTGSAGSAFPLNQWVHMVGVFDGSVITFYTNGVKAGQSGVSAGAVNLAGKSWFLGSYGDAEGYQNIRFTGVMDEIRLSNVARGSNWVWATHRTVASNATWQTYGAIEDNDGDWPGIFTNGVPVAAGGTVLSANEESRSVSGWVLGATNGTQITFGARLKRYGNALHLGTGSMQRVSITAF